MKKVIYTCILALIIASCAKDDSTGFLLDMAGVKIAPDDGITFAVGEETSYEPAIEWNGTKEADYEYLWTLNGRDTLSTERILKHVFTESGTFYLTYQMKDKKNGIVYGQDFKATISTPFFLGWLALSEGQDNSSHLSFIHMTSFKSYPDIFANMYPGESLGSGPIKLRSHCLAKTDQVLVIQENGGNVELDGASFRKVSELGMEFIGEEYPEEEGGFKLADVLYTHRYPEIALSKNGKLYDRITKSPTSSSTKFQTSFFTTQPYLHVGGDYKITAFTYPGASTYVQPLYDGLNRRWIAYHLTSSIPYNIPLFTTTQTFEDGYDYVRGMASDVDMVYAQSYNESTYNLYVSSILERGGSYSMTSCKLALSTSNYKITVTDVKQKPISAPGIDSETVFFMPRGSATKFANDPHMFFSIGRKLYFFHWSTGQVYLFRDFSKETSAPAGDIVAIEQNGNATQLGVAFEDGKVFICSLDVAKLNAIRQSNLDPEDMNNGLVLAQISDVPGKIVDLKFKYGKASNYTGAKIAY